MGQVRLIITEHHIINFIRKIWCFLPSNLGFMCFNQVVGVIMLLEGFNSRVTLTIINTFNHFQFIIQAQQNSSLNHPYQSFLIKMYENLKNYFAMMTIARLIEVVIISSFIILVLKVELVALNQLIDSVIINSLLFVMINYEQVLRYVEFIMFFKFQVTEVVNYIDRLILLHHVTVIRNL